MAVLSSSGAWRARRAALGAPGRLDRRALAAARAAAGAMARGRQPGLDLAAGAAAAGLCLGNAARPGRQRRPVAQHRRQPAARAGRLRRRRPAGPAAGRGHGPVAPARSLLLPTFNALVQIPVLAWLPFVLLLVGIGEALKIILIAKAALVPVTLNTLQGFRQPARRCARWDASMATRAQEVLEIVLPLATPTLFTGLRLGFTKAWLSLVVVELVASSEGLGYLIVRPPAVPAGSGHGRRGRGGRDRLRHRPRAGLDRDEAIRGPAAQAAGAPR